MARYGSQSMTGRLERVLVRPPLAEDAERWRDYGWRAAPDHAAAAAEHELLCGILEAAGAEVVVSRHDPGNPGRDLRLRPGARRCGGRGAAAAGEGRTARRAERDREPRSPPPTFPSRPSSTEPVLAEGGDTVWLDERTLLVGIGYRTNPAAVPALADAFPGVDVIAFDLPHWNGRGEVMHLMSFISPLDRDLALVYPRIAPVRLLELLAERGIEVVEVPDEEFETQGPNVLALGPRHALALDGNPETRRRMERAGVDVVVYRGEEISRKGDGGPTCLTRPLLRA